MKNVNLIVLSVFGLCLGSFVNALVFRLHEQSKPSKTKIPKPKANLSILRGRSMCPRCQHVLAARDLIPVISWLWLKGKCRYCATSISWQYPFTELVTAGLFIFSYIYWPQALHGRGLFEFGLWLLFLTGFVALALYDGKWFMLPNRITYPLIILASIQLLIIVTLYHGGLNTLIGALWGAVLLGGLFYALFRVSREQWIGGGDYKLGILLGLLVGGPLMSLLVLFLAACGGSLVALPLLAKGQVRRGSHLPFGPFLLLAGIIVRLFGASLIVWYKRQAGLL